MMNLIYKITKFEQRLQKLTKFFSKYERTGLKL